MKRGISPENSSFSRRGRTLAATQIETVPANASLQARLLENGNNPIHPSVQEAIGVGQQRNDRRLPGLDTAATTIGAPVSRATRARYSSNHYWGPRQSGFDSALNIKILVAAERRETPIEAPPSET
nr:rhomboid-like protein 15 [Tanacetum cinerariifolium]